MNAVKYTVNHDQPMNGEFAVWANVLSPRKVFTGRAAASSA
jgi:hypothetical protein